MYNVLLVEDDKDISALNKKMLESTGKYNVRLAMTLTEARRQIAAFPPDIIILDIMLPDGSGLEFIPEIHAVTDAPTLVISTRNTPLDTIRGIERGGDNYIATPYEPEAMTTLVQSMLRREKKPVSAAPSITIVRSNLTLDLIAKRAYLSGIDMGLEGKEFPLLSLLVRDEGKTVGATGLLKTVFKSDDESDINTLHKQISALCTKLESGECGYTIKNIHSDGFRFEKA